MDSNQYDGLIQHLDNIYQELYTIKSQQLEIHGNVDNLLTEYMANREIESGENAQLRNNQTQLNATGILIAIILALIIIYEFITRSMKC